MQELEMKIIHQVICTVVSTVAVVNRKEIDTILLLLAFYSSLIVNYSIFIVCSYYTFITIHSISLHRAMRDHTASISSINRWRVDSTAYYFIAILKVTCFALRNKRLLFDNSLCRVCHLDSLSHKIQLFRIRSSISFIIASLVLLLQTLMIRSLLLS